MAVGAAPSAEKSAAVPVGYSAEGGGVAGAPLGAVAPLPEWSSGPPPRNTGSHPLPRPPSRESGGARWGRSDSEGSGRSGKSGLLLKGFGAMSEEAEVASAEVADDGGSSAADGAGHLALSEGVDLPHYGRLLWRDAAHAAAQWLRSPAHMLLLLWIVAVAVAGGILFLVMTGMLNGAIPRKRERNTWYEVCNQVLNALFTLMCLVLHPGRVRDAVQLYRWAPKHILRMRQRYNKGGTRKPGEWRHMVVVVTLLHLNCLFQYALAGLNWGYSRARRPVAAVAVTVAGAILCPAVAGLYNSLSPLGRDYGPAALDDLDAAGAAAAPPAGGGKRRLLERSRTFYSRHAPVPDPRWQGALLAGACAQPRVALSAALCCLCVFGGNMQRLGFGNRWVHAATFALFLAAPFLVFALASLNLNTGIRQYLAITGAVLSLLGLLYGGYWRLKMRHAYGLPKSRWCCGQPKATDLATWFFCPCCALCQEVRTAEAYDIVDRSFYPQGAVGGGAAAAAGLGAVPRMEPPPRLATLSREAELVPPFQRV